MDWAPLTALPSAALMLRNLAPGWVFMWLLAFAIFLGCKWLTWRQACRSGSNPSLARSLAYLFAWPGMDAKPFLATPEPIWRKAGLPITISTRLSAAVKTLASFALIWAAAHGSLSDAPLARGWLGMLGLALFLHFGLFHLLALAWQSAGVNARPLMRAPLSAVSLAEFWSGRWNTAFSTLARQFAFRPLARRWGASKATLIVFLLSGLIHEAVISLPARGGFGLPTAYFVLQGLGVLAERSKCGRRLGLGHGLRGWLFVAACAGGPAFWLFHPPFIHNVILPMLNAIGRK